MKKLNLGCGKKKVEGYINIDILEMVKPDIVLDVERYGLKQFDDNSINEVRAFDFLEHIRIGKTVFVIEEIYRVLKPDGKFEHLTPSTDGRGAFQCPLHVSFWNINSWLFWLMPDDRDVHGITAKWKETSLHDVITNTYGNVIHTHGTFYADKDGAA